jgi:hypothetical protein
VVVAALAATGWALKPIEQPAWEAVSRNQPALRLDSVSANVGEGIVVGMLGGLRGVAADICWLRAYSDWEDDNVSDFPVGVQLTVDFDPRPIGFWTTGALQLAFDVPHWLTDENGTPYDRIPPNAKVRVAIDQFWGNKAISFLEQGLTYHPNSYNLYLQIANIYAIKLVGGPRDGRFDAMQLNDLAMAAKYYRKAAEAPGAEALAARLYARKLIDLGKDSKDPSKFQEAYDWLLALYPKLPKEGVLPEGFQKPAGPMPQHLEVESENRSMALELIREVENEMGIPPEKAFQP